MILARAAGRAGIAADVVSLPHGSRRTIAVFEREIELDRFGAREGWRRPDSIARDEMIERELAAWRVDDLRVSVELEPALGDRRSARVLAGDRLRTILVATIPVVAAPAIGALSPAPDGRHAVLSIIHRGVESAYVVDVLRARAMLLNAEALDAHESGEEAVAAALLEQAVAVDPRFGDAIYNLACVHALLGDSTRAVEELRIALALDPVRYRRLARVDPDLLRIRAHPEICALLSSCDLGSDGLPRNPP
jgi:hypothetical protein